MTERTRLESVSWGQIRGKLLPSNRESRHRAILRDVSAARFDVLTLRPDVPPAGAGGRPIPSGQGQDIATLTKRRKEEGRGYLRALLG